MFNKEELFKGSNLFYTILICMLWSNNVLISYIRAFFARLPIISNFAGYIIPTAIVLCIVFCFKKIVSKIKTVDVFFVIVCIFVYFSHYALFPENQEYILLQTPTFLSVLILYFVGVSFEYENKDLFNLLYYVSLINTVCFTIYNLFINEIDTLELLSGAMFLSYTILPHLCLIFYYVLKKISVVNVAVFAAGVVMMFSLGNRGAIGCLAVFVVLALIFIYGKAHPVLLGTIIIAFIVIITTPIFDIIFEWLHSFAKDNGLSTRIFDKFLEGEISNDSGRGVLQEKVIAAIWDKPLFGNGIMSDRRIIGAYAHNIAYEFMVDYGIIIGIALLAAVLIIFVKAAMVNKNNHNVLAILFIMFCRGIVRLFVSGTYLDEIYFFIFIGFCIAAIRLQNSKNNIIEREKT